ncbi:MAG: asparagine synthase (glutamine-hydrolyzing) [Acidimicrobiales bacterium]|nr:MAG: asparagine synthase (glutamine-hydrolyzing) [Acidimicrobiales bacterium]
MCGITGWVSFDRDLTRHQTDLDAMTTTMACRGPDAEGSWLDRHVALGHRRLAIIDLEGGAQPMSVKTDEGTVAIVYSGEVYNFAELRDELRRRGHKFRSRSDTEVVLRGYLEWDEAVAERLNGMYAFAIWDTRMEKLVMIRDRMGIKPFYLYPTADGALFGSEPKAILANPLAERAVDLDGMRELFSFTKTPGHAVWYGMREVLPGTVVTVSRDGIREHTYWSLHTRSHTDDQQTSVDTVRSLLDDIVTRQLVADVPRCVLLSGGLDSSAITALAAAQLGKRNEQVRSFAVDFAGQTENFTPDHLRGTPDTPYAHELATYVGSRHQDIVLNDTTLADPAIRRAVVTARDLPGGAMGDMDASLYLLFKGIREHSTVALSGESADEIFGGYSWFFDPEVQTTDNFPWLTFLQSRQPIPVLDLLRDDLTTALDLPGYVHDKYASAVAEVEPGDAETEQERRMRVICYLHLTRFVRMLLDRKDRMSMAVGLEVRVPFCDHRLVEYVYNTPWALKTFDGREKSLLRAATANILPQSVLQRVKSPYPSTQDPRYAVALQQQAKELLSTSQEPLFELVDRQWIENAVQQDPSTIPISVRNSIDMALDLNTWLDIYRPRLRLP